MGSPTSPIESESEYGGLAYADSTDYEDDGPNVNTTKTSNEEKRAYDVRESIAQALNDAATKKGSRHIQFGSVSLRSRSRSSDIGDRKSAASNGSAKAMAVAISRADSVSSYSSTSSAGGDSAIRARARADSSSTVARALGLCQTPPSEYAKLGGPGVKGVGGRMRSASGTSSASNGSRSVHSMSNSNPMERGMETLMEDDANGKTTAMTTMPMTSAAVSGTQRSLFGSVSSTRSALRRADTAGSSTSSRDERSRRLQDDADESVIGGVSGGGSKAHRSNTVPGHQPQQLQSPDGGKPVKLPTRSLTSPQLERHAPALPLGGGVRDGGGGGTPTKGKGVLKKERAAKKVRACLRCAKTIEDGRWVSVDGGGVLCERCWKNMYLPKVRFCFFFLEGSKKLMWNFLCSVVDVTSRSNVRLYLLPMGSSRGSTTRNASIAIHAKFVFSLPSSSKTKLLTTSTHRNPSQTKLSTYTTANPSAPTTTTKPTTRSAPPRVAGSPSRARVRCRTRETGIILNI